MQYAKLFVALSVTAILFVPSSPARGQSLDEIVKEAKKEGALKLGLSPRWQVKGRPEGKGIVEAFQRRYPFIKQIDYERVGGSRARDKVITELAAGMASYDVTVLSNFQVPKALKANIIKLVDWRSLGLTPEQIGFEGVGVHLEYGVFGIGYNRKLVTDAVGKKMTWDDCVSSKWNGKGIMNDTPGQLEILWQPHSWGRDKTLAHARGLKENNTFFHRSSRESMRKVAIGEYAINCGGLLHNYFLLNKYEGLKDLGYVQPDPAPVTNRGIYYIPSSVKHPNAAKLFLLWAVSDEGQKAVVKARFAADPTVSGTEVHELVRGKTLVWMKPEAMKKFKEIRQEILEAIGMPVVR